jgi:two-component system LytT family response regulator
MQSERERAPIRAAIVDDEPLGRSRIRELLQEEQDIEVVGEYRDAHRAGAGLAALSPDLLFLDVQMPRGSAFTILEGLAQQERRPATIFVTAHEQYALKAFDVNAVDYLLKPFDTERFRRSLERARQYFDKVVPVAEPVRTLPAARTQEPLTRLAVKTNGKVHVLRVEDIDWIETAGNYVRLHVGRQSYLYRDSLVHFESKLHPRRFVRIHQSTIVNIDRVAHLQPSFNREHVVVLRDGTDLTLSAPYRRRIEMFVGPF